MVEGKKRHGTRKIQRTRPEKVKKVFFFFLFSPSSLFHISI